MQIGETAIYCHTAELMCETVIIFEYFIKLITKISIHLNIKFFKISLVNSDRQQIK